MTNKIEISRELAERLASSYLSTRNAAMYVLRGILAAPAVEHQAEPVYAIACRKYPRNAAQVPACRSDCPCGQPAPVSAAAPCQWSDGQILDFLGVALRNVDLSGEVKLSEIRQGFKYVRDNTCLDKVKELNQ